MNFEKTYIIVKPEYANMQSAIVWYILSAAKLRISGIHKLTLPIEVIETLYSDKTKRTEALKYYSAPSIIIFIEGYNAIEILNRKISCEYNELLNRPTDKIENIKHFNMLKQLLPPP